MSNPNPILEGLQKDYVRDHPRRPKFTPEGSMAPSPVASALAAVEHTAAMLDQIRSSKLAVALHDAGLGGLLSDSAVSHVVAIVRELEEPRRQAQADARARRRANGNGNGNGGPQSGPQPQATT